MIFFEGEPPSGEPAASKSSDENAKRVSSLLSRAFGICSGELLAFKYESEGTYRALRLPPNLTDFLDQQGGIGVELTAVAQGGIVGDPYWPGKFFLPPARSYLGDFEFEEAWRFVVHGAMSGVWRGLIRLWLDHFAPTADSRMPKHHLLRVPGELSFTVTGGLWSFLKEIGLDPHPSSLAVLASSMLEETADLWETEDAVSGYFYTGVSLGCMMAGIPPRHPMGIPILEEGQSLLYEGCAVISSMDVQDVLGPEFPCSWFDLYETGILDPACVDVNPFMGSHVEGKVLRVDEARLLALAEEENL